MRSYLVLSNMTISRITYRRRVWVEAEERRKKGRRQEALAGLQVQLGSLRVHSLGTLVPAAWGSHSQHVSRTSSSNHNSSFLVFEVNICIQALIPVGFSASRTYWSVTNPRKRTKYRCTTR